MIGREQDVVSQNIPWWRVVISRRASRGEFHRASGAAIAGHALPQTSRPATRRCVVSSFKLHRIAIDDDANVELPIAQRRSSLVVRPDVVHGVSTIDALKDVFNLARVRLTLPTRCRIVTRNDRDVSSRGVREFKRQPRTVVVDNE